MGILDEAIREHLELKRQHGAGDTELKKIEDEAFGPPERPGFEPADPLAEAPTEYIEQPQAPEPPDDLPPRRRAPDIADLQEGPEPEEPAAAADREEKRLIAEQPTELYEVEAELGGATAPSPTEEELVEAEIGEPRLAAPDPLAADADDEDDEEGEGDEEEDDFWDEQRLSEELDQALEAPEEDLLEETPDFLEDAPEDDRLWFEQKPPKDFDFDD